MNNENQIDVIVEARMTSSRLPGKVLMPGCGKVMLHHLIERAKSVPEVSNVIIATTVNRTDDCIVELAEELGVWCFRGDEDDVLGRVVKASRRFGTDIIVEITGDDPLLDPGISSRVIRAFLEKEGEVEFVTNDLTATFPVGFNTRAFRRQLLEAVEKKATHPVDREHVVNYICKRPDEFRIYNLEAEGFYRRPDLRLTLDTMEDYRVIKAVFDALYPENPGFTAKDIYDFLDGNPDIRDINKHIVQRTYEYA
ncbi:MAG: glycosyltransferase family protein [Nitrospirae bacterium]|nr:glycosyltransferase family protein [Nitrospirota bacterium]